MWRLALGVVLLGLALPTGASANDYPTDARADYVFACMASNGETRQILKQCSCSIDVIASILPYRQYVEAETVMSMRQIGGEKGALFRSGPDMNAVIADLKRAQAEAEIRCF
ncbi:MAG: hypothetical protein ACREDZ_13870 [Kiloniellales bacterium]